jgi:hypothetical protein
MPLANLGLPMDENLMNYTSSPIIKTAIERLLTNIIESQVYLSMQSPTYLVVLNKLI